MQQTLFEPENCEKQEDGIREIHPVIISASRATDIPALYMDWFLDRLSKGYIIWKNPYRPSQKQKVCFDKTRAIVFWTKNPAPLLEHKSAIDQLGFRYYVQLTLNNYEPEGFEPFIPSFKARINGFKKLSKAIGKERVIWRFDPLILSDNIDHEKIMAKIKQTGDKIAPYTNKLVFSFIDIKKYRTVTGNLKNNGFCDVREFTEQEKYETGEFLAEFNRKWKLEIMSCCEDIDLSEFGIGHNRCVDDSLLTKMFSDDPSMLSYLKNNCSKDKGQRSGCKCIKSKDIGQYSTCTNLCRYCYANHNETKVRKNYTLHRKHMESGQELPSIIPENPVS